MFSKCERGASADPDQLPDVVLLENTQPQVIADSGLVLPAEACMEAADYPITDIEPAVRSAFSVDDVLYPGYANVTSMVLYYNKAHWAAAGLDPEAPPETLDELQEQAQALQDAGVSPSPLSFKVSHTVLENWLSGVFLTVPPEVAMKTKLSSAYSLMGSTALIRSSSSSGSKFTIGLPREPRLASGTW